MNGAPPIRKLEHEAWVFLNRHGHNPLSAR